MQSIWSPSGFDVHCRSLLGLHVLTLVGTLIFVPAWYFMAMTSIERYWAITAAELGMAVCVYLFVASACATVTLRSFKRRMAYAFLAVAVLSIATGLGAWAGWRSFKSTSDLPIGTQHV